MTHDDELREGLARQGYLSSVHKEVLVGRIVPTWESLNEDTKDIFREAIDVCFGPIILAYVEMRVAEERRRNFDSDDKYACAIEDKKLEVARAAWRKAIGKEPDEPQTT